MPSKRDLSGWYKLRWKILRRDQYTCQYCGQSAPNVQLEIDHRIPIIDGGTDGEDNLVTSCWACNRGKNGLRQSIILSQKKREERIIKAREPVRQNEVRQLILNNKGVGNKDIMRQLSLNRGQVDTTLSRLKGKGIIIKREDKWYLA